MSNRELEIAPAEYYDFIIDLLSCNEGVMPTSEVYEAIESFFGTNFSAADQRLMKLPNGKKRPKWKKTFWTQTRPEWLLLQELWNSTLDANMQKAGRTCHQRCCHEEL